MHAGKVLSFTLFALLIAGPLSSLAIDAYSASYLIELYEKSKNDLLGIIGSLGSSEDVTNETDINSTLTTVTRCSYAKEEVIRILGVADSYIEQAKSLLSSGSYEEAAKLALKALNTIGRAWILVGQCFGSRVVEATNITTNITSAIVNATVNASINANVTNTTINATVNASRTAPGLLVAILRHEIRLARLNAIITKAENLGLNVSVAKNLSIQAVRLLEEARAQALAGNVNAAAQLLAEANGLMAQMVKSLKAGSSKAIKMGKLEEIRARMRNETAKPEKLIPPGLEKKEAWKGDKGEPGFPPGLKKKEDKGKPGVPPGKPEVPPGKEEDKGKPEVPGKGKKN